MEYTTTYSPNGQATAVSLDLLGLYRPVDTISVDEEYESKTTDLTETITGDKFSSNVIAVGDETFAMTQDTTIINAPLVKTKKFNFWLNAGVIPVESITENFEKKLLLGTFATAFMEVFGGKSSLIIFFLVFAGIHFIVSLFKRDGETFQIKLSRVVSSIMLVAISGLASVFLKVQTESNPELSILFKYFDVFFIVLVIFIANYLYETFRILVKASDLAKTGAISKAYKVMLDVIDAFKASVRKHFGDNILTEDN